MMTTEDDRKTVWLFAYMVVLHRAEPAPPVSHMTHNDIAKVAAEKAVQHFEEFMNQQPVEGR